MSVVSLAGGLLLAGGAPVEAAPDGLKQQLSAMFAVGLKASATSRQAAEARYEAARKIAPDDVRVPYSLALVQLKHRKYDRADALLAEVLKQNRNILPAWRLKIRGQVLAERYPQALAEMQSFARTFPREPDERSLAKYAPQAEHLGRMFGYLESAAAEKIDKVLLKDFARRIPGGWSPSWAKGFAAGRLAVVLEFGKQSRELREARRQAIGDEEKQKQLDLQYVEQQRADFVKQRAAAKERIETVNESFKTQSSDIAQKAAPIEKRYKELLEERRQLKRRVREIEGIIDAILSDSEEGRGGRGVGRLENERRKVKGELKKVDAEGRKVEAEGLKLLAQRNALRAAYQQEMKALQRAERKRQRTERVLRSTERDAKRESTGNSARLRRRGSQRFSLDTYVEFSWQQATQQVLDSLR
ncbi:MAG: hypothetical protein IIA67_08820 [Planctomycetes bacterium]|nr:hypothetical protein [Planctomycetota bacterium]